MEINFKMSEQDHRAIAAEVVRLLQEQTPAPAPVPEVFDEWLTVKEVAAIFKKSVDTIWLWRRSGRFPEPDRRFGTRWKRSEITQFMEVA